ncbi:MAG: radical SAM protein, partial [Anaerolineae bacterium]
SPGLYHFLQEDHGERVRIHLRLDPDGHGTLIVNANQILHLNPTAALMAYLILNRVETKAALRALQRRFHVPRSRLRADFDHFRASLEALLQPDACPLCTLPEAEVIAPFSHRPQAPYRMDLALTYRCNDDCAHCYNARPRDFPEMPTQTWKAILDRLWELGIPHVVFTGGEPTLRDDLPELIAHAEANGQITGLNTNARRLSDQRFLARLVEAGLDHIQITVESHDPAIHDRMVGKRGAWQQTIAGLKNALQTRLYVMTNTTMLQDNHTTLGETLDFLADLGVPTIGLNALIFAGHGRTVGTGLPEDRLAPLLDLARRKTQAHGQRLIWYTPTQYCNFDPQQMELGVKGCTAALYNMCIEPDGGVLPCQSYYRPLGNILTDGWDAIWNHALARRIRERDYIPEKCTACHLLPECGGGCPLMLEAPSPTLIPLEALT